MIHHRLRVKELKACAARARAVRGIRARARLRVVVRDRVRASHTPNRD
jgi:hypothetical protein